MLRKPTSLNGLGLVQVILAATFVVWLLFFPERGDAFAWPVVPRLTAMFVGASFIARAYLGFHLWRERYWYRLRWQVWGNLGFLVVIFAATFWHIDEMNWSSNLLVAHIWVVAYAVEPLLLIIIEPRGEEADAPLPHELREGPISQTFKRLMVTLYVILMVIAALLFLNPEFADTRWPWPLDPFDARIMAAFAVLPALWAVRVYFMEDWAEAKLAVRGLIIQGAALVVLYFITVGEFRSTNRVEYGVALTVMTILTTYGYWRQERASTQAAVVEVQ